MPSGRYKTHKVDLTGWNDKDNTLLWRKAWADYTNNFLERNGSLERIDHRSNAERGIDELPTVHMGVAACQMEKKGIATEKGELNRNIQKANRLIREIRAQIGKLNTAYQAAGYSAAAAQTSYKEFYKILGDTDTATEAPARAVRMYRYLSSMVWKVCRRRG